MVGIANTFDHAGPMARTVAETALTPEVIVDKDPMDPRQGEVPVQLYTGSLAGGANGLRIGVLKEGFGLGLSEPDVDAAVHKAERPWPFPGTSGQFQTTLEHHPPVPFSRRVSGWDRPRIGWPAGLCFLRVCFMSRSSISVV